MLAQVLVRPRHPHGAEQVDGTRSRLGSRPAVAEPQRLGQVVADRAHRVDAGARVLEDHRRAAAPQLEGSRVGRRAPRAVEAHGAAGRRAIGEQAEHRAGGERLAGAGLADEAHGLPAATLSEMPSRSRVPSGRSRV